MKLRLSYSFLLQWHNGRYQDALDMYFHKPMVRSHQMEDGIKYHKQWEDTILDKGKLTIGKTEFTFENPICEEYFKVDYNEQFELSGKIDCRDAMWANSIIYDWKSGKMGSLDYAGSYQMGMYFLILELAKLPVDQGILAHWNQYNNTADITIVWNTKREVDKARNAIDTLGSEIYEYFIDNKLSFDKP